MKKITAILLALLMMASFVACTNVTEQPDSTQSPGTSDVSGNENNGENTTSEPKKGGQLVIGVNQDFLQPLWYNHRQPKDFLYTNCIMETLLMFDENGDPQPYLCESFEADMDNLTYTIKLKEGILFHDGTELDAEVCKWNLDIYKERGVLSSSFLGNVESFEVTGDYEVTIHMSAWDSTLPYGLARAAGFMCSKEAYESMGEAEFEKAPVGTGPFMFDSREYDVSVTFVKFADYWQGEPLLDSVKFVYYESDAVAQAALEVGDIDVFFPESLDVATYLGEEGYDVIKTKVPAQAASFGFECNNPDSPLYDVKVRQAICHALDRDAIMAATYGDYGVVSTQYALPGSTYYNDEITNFDYDPELAKQLLAEAGYPDGFETSIWIYNTATLQVKACQIITEQLAAVGIDCEIKITDLAAFIVGIDGWGDGLFYHAMTLSNGTPSILNANFVQNLTSGLGVTSFLHPDDLDAVIKKGVATSGDESVEAFKEAQKLIFEDYCMLKYFGAAFSCTVRSPKVKDSAIGEVALGVPGAWTMWTAWIDE